jgi:hypothetical protein
MEDHSLMGPAVMDNSFLIQMMMHGPAVMTGVLGYYRTFRGWLRAVCMTWARWTPSAPVP